MERRARDVRIRGARSDPERAALGVPALRRFRAGSLRRAPGLLERARGGGRSGRRGRRARPLRPGEVLSPDSADRGVPQGALPARAHPADLGGRRQRHARLRGRGLRGRPARSERGSDDVLRFPRPPAGAGGRAPRRQSRAGHGPAPRTLAHENANCYLEIPNRNLSADFLEVISRMAAGQMPEADDFFMSIYMVDLSLDDIGVALTPESIAWSHERLRRKPASLDY